MRVCEGWTVAINDTLDRVSLAIGMNEVSMTSGLAMASMRRPGAASFRAASAPLLRKDMEEACLAIDYESLRKRCGVLQALIENAVAAEVEFTTGGVNTTEALNVLEAADIKSKGHYTESPEAA